MIWALVAAIVVGFVVNATTLHDPELAGALLLAAIIAAAYLGAAHEKRNR